MSAEKIFYLNKCGLPSDITKKILDNYFSYVYCIDCYKYAPAKNSKKCNSCNMCLCAKHEKKALKWGLYYTVMQNYRMCDSCCWNSIT
jgi:hypothetical protein